MNAARFPVGACWCINSTLAVLVWCLILGVAL